MVKPYLARTVNCKQHFHWSDFMYMYLAVYVTDTIVLRTWLVKNCIGLVKILEISPYAKNKHFLRPVKVGSFLPSLITVPKLNIMFEVQLYPMYSTKGWD